MGGWVVVGILVAVVVIAGGYYVWTHRPGGGGVAGGGGAGGKPGPQDVGACYVSAQLMGTMTLDECKALGGTKFVPNAVDMQTVNPQTGEPL